MGNGELKIGDRVKFYGYNGLDGRGEIVGFCGFGLFANVRTHWTHSGEEFVARVSIMNMKKETKE